ncbi:hypothetical protein J3L16_11580 [Alteromonas sp. 5E99-2]|uniref:hypothetical protein n=1 Tax=Alteromonas sp. 5E99-2 TaxID=2817683 RepID=UPI001A996437|nr:hypothetical protein [Alteromonas sp. 5E99-2]MBO1256322.1 hypothetical protein [Alteromonas sp. 5E99-2]
MKAMYFVFLLSFNLSANEWMNFEWGQQTIDGVELKRAAMLVKLNDGTRLQLDTGAPSSYLYAPAYQFDGNKIMTFDTTSGQSINDTFKIHDTKKSDEHAVGTLGASFFKDSMLIIDFPRNRFMKANAIPEELATSQINYIDGQVTDSLHIVTSVNVGDVTLSPVVFDTGSSIFKLVLNKEQWLQLVSKEHATAPEHTMEVPAWDRKVILYGAKSRSPICLGTICVEGNVYYSDDPQLDFANAGLAGLMGNAILEDKYILILDYANKRIGTIEAQ